MAVNFWVNKKRFGNKKFVLKKRMIMDEQVLQFESFESEKKINKTYESVIGAKNDGWRKL